MCVARHRAPPSQCSQIRRGKVHLNAYVFLSKSVRYHYRRGRSGGRIRDSGGWWRGGTRCDRSGSARARGRVMVEERDVREEMGIEGQLRRASSLKGCSERQK